MAIRRLVLALAAVWATGCGNTAITVGGHTLEPLSADMMQVYGLPYVYLTDIPDFCEKLRAAYSNTGGCNGTASSSYSSPFSLGGTYFMIGAFGASDGARLNVLPMTSSTNYAVSSGAYVNFMTIGTPGGNYTNTATTGTVTIEQFRSAQHIAGTYDLTFQYGERKQGHFNARYCDAMERMYQASQNTRTCNESMQTSSYYRACSCGGRSATSSCTKSSTGSTWTCSCSNGSSSSTCTQSYTPTTGSDTGTCCSLQL